MRAIVCGGRTLTDRDWIFGKLDDVFFGQMPTILHGGCAGVDSIAGEWARSRGLPCEVYPADWNRYGRAAGPMRNRKMIRSNPDVVVAFPGGRGTSSMRILAKIAGVRLVDVDLST